MYQDYNPNDIYIKSTDYDRTIMSAQSNLAAIYPPHEFQIWNKYIPWQPIPVHTIPEEEDALIWPHKPCPAYDYLMAQLFKTKQFELIASENAGLYKYLTDNSGFSVTGIQNAADLYDVLLIEGIFYNKTYVRLEGTHCTFYFYENNFKFQIT